MKPNITLLSKAGLNLISVLDVATLQQPILDALSKDGVQLDRFKRLVLLCNAGRTDGDNLWYAVQEAGMNRPNPIDTFSTETAQSWIATELQNADSEILYPGPTSVSLIQLGKAAGWHHDSPLGLGIHAQYGVWFAYRVAFLTAFELPITVPLELDSPCDSCVEKPCITACPAGAVVGIGKFDFPSCARFRLQNDSPCADRCLSRIACPVGQEYRYPLEQIQYHYNLSRETYRKWFRISD